MREWVSENRLVVSFFLASVAVLLISLAAYGCQISDMIRVDVPKDVQHAVGIEGKVTLTQIPDVWDDWHDYVEKNTKRLEAETERSYELLGFINSATNIAIGAAEGAASSFPGGAILIGILSGAAGLYMKKPGTDRVIAKEKEASYNAGLEKAKAIGLAVGLGDGTDGTA
jgi:hypothetical protein